MRFLLVIPLTAWEPRPGYSEFSPLCGDNIFNWRKSNGGGCLLLRRTLLCWKCMV